MEINEPNNPLLYVSFNQNMTRICVGTKAGFLIYGTDAFECVYKLDIPGGCAIVEVLFDSFLVAVVGTGNHPTSSRRHVQIYNLKQKQEISRLPFETPVLAVKMNTKRMIVVLEGEIHIFDTLSLTLVNKITTNPNPNGLCALSYGEDILMAYPATRESLQGDVVLYNPISLSKTQQISRLHDHPLTCIEFSPDGKWLATASAQGTRIQITPVSTPTTHYTFRRGSTAADISSVTFSKDGTYFAASSTRETVHVFCLKDAQSENSSSSYASAWIPGVLNEPRSISEIKLPASMKKLVGFSNSALGVVFTITQDGKFSKWQIINDTDKTRSRVCKLLQEESLLKEYYN